MKKQVRNHANFPRAGTIWTPSDLSTAVEYEWSQNLNQKGENDVKMM